MYVTSPSEGLVEEFDPLSEYRMSSQASNVQPMFETSIVCVIQSPDEAIQYVCYPTESKIYFKSSSGQRQLMTN